MKRIFTKCSLVLLMLTSLAPQIVAADVPVSSAVQSANHPFFDNQQLPSWSKLTPEQALIDAQEAVQRAMDRVAEICTLSPQDATYENTYKALNAATYELECVSMQVMHLSMVCDSEQMRETMAMLTQCMSEIMRELYTNEQLWQLLKAAAAPEKTESLSPARKRAVKQLYDIFMDNGAELPKEQKERIVQLEHELVVLSQEFDRLLHDHTQQWELLITNEAELGGVDPEFMEMMYSAALERGLCTPEKPAWLISMRDETAMIVMTVCPVEETRKKCWEGCMGGGKGTPYDTTKIIDQLMEKRTERARLLGFANHADYEARTRMVHNGAEAMAFVDYLMRQLKPAYDEEVRKILACYEYYMGKKGVSAIPPWDEFMARNMYYGSMNTPAMSLSAYLPKKDVLNGLCQLYSGLMGLTYQNLPTICLAPGETCPEGMVEAWDPDVQCISVSDTESGEVLGYFYVDWYARGNKRAGAWCAPIRVSENGPHIATLELNCMRPEEGMPDVFSHQEVSNLFHEFGHVMHNLLSHTEERGHSAYGVAWDFVELPSTLSEKWANSAEVLATFARHYRTGKPCPKSMLKRLEESGDVMAAYSYMDTLCKAKLDLEIHMNYEEKFKGRSIDEVSAELLKGYEIPYTQCQYSTLRSLSHCFSGGYSAGVYSYLWSAVLAADAFTRFEKEGIMNPEVGKAYRHTILDKGDSIAPEELYRMFMGREPKVDAFMKANKLNRN